VRRFAFCCRNHIFYARFWNTATKTYAGAKSTGEQDEDAARTVESEPLIPFLEKSWDYDESEYVAEKLDYDQSIGRRHAMSKHTGWTIGAICSQTSSLVKSRGMIFAHFRRH